MAIDKRTMKSDKCRECEAPIYRNARLPRLCRNCGLRKSKVSVSDNCRLCGADIIRDRKKSRVCNPCKRRALILKGGGTKSQNTTATTGGTSRSATAFRSENDFFPICRSSPQRQYSQPQNQSTTSTPTFLDRTTTTTSSTNYKCETLLNRPFSTGEWPISFNWDITFNTAAAAVSK